ncbi:alcohol dehydrogenase catalytic domain-containing protein [Streptomyces sp. NPDC020801]
MPCAVTGAQGVGGPCTQRPGQGPPLGLAVRWPDRSTDAVVRVVLCCVCRSDLWPHKSMPAAETGRPVGHELLAVVQESGSDVSGGKAADLVVSTPARRCSSATTTPGRSPGSASAAWTADRQA